MGLYAEFDDVAKRFEGDLPSDREDWVELRIDDVEAELIGIVPSLAEEFVGEMKPDRMKRVRRLICDKVLSLYRNPDGALSFSNAMGPYTESRTLSRAQQGSWIAFTDEELNAVGYVSTSGSSGSVRLRARSYGGWPYGRYDESCGPYDRYNRCD